MIVYKSAYIYVRELLKTMKNLNREREIK